LAIFKIEELQKEALEHEWELISTEYHNLNSELEYLCSKKHTLYLPYKKIRNKYECPICKEFSNSTEIDIINIPKIKSENITRLLALDQSTKITGYAIFDNDILIKYGIVEIKGKEASSRIIKVRKWIKLMIDTWKPDLVVLEDIQLQNEEQEGTKNVLTYKILAELLGVLEVFFTEYNIKYVLANISKWRNSENITGKRREDKKRCAQERIKKCYNIDTTDDEADAILIGRYIIESQKEEKIIHW